MQARGLVEPIAINLLEQMRIEIASFDFIPEENSPLPASMLAYLAALKALFAKSGELNVDLIYANLRVWSHEAQKYMKPLRYGSEENEQTLAIAGAVQALHSSFSAHVPSYDRLNLNQFFSFTGYDYSRESEFNRYQLDTYLSGAKHPDNIHYVLFGIHHPGYAMDIFHLFKMNHLLGPNRNEYKYWQFALDYQSESLLNILSHLHGSGILNYLSLSHLISCRAHLDEIAQALGPVEKTMEELDDMFDMAISSEFGKIRRITEASKIHEHTAFDYEESDSEEECEWKKEQAKGENKDDATPDLCQKLEAFKVLVNNIKRSASLKSICIENVKHLFFCEQLKNENLHNLPMELREAIVLPDAGKQKKEEEYHREYHLHPG